MTEYEIVEEPERTTAVVRGKGIVMTELAPFFDASFGTLGAAIGAGDVTPLSASFAFYPAMPTDVADLEVGFVTDRPVEESGDVVSSTLPAGRIVRSVYAGGFDGLSDAWGALMAWTAGQGLTPAGQFWEVYLTEPSPEMDPADLRTELNLLLS